MTLTFSKLCDGKLTDDIYVSWPRFLCKDKPIVRHGHEDAQEISEALKSRDVFAVDFTCYAIQSNSILLALHSEASAWLIGGYIYFIINSLCSQIYRYGITSESVDLYIIGPAVHVVRCLEGNIDFNYETGGLRNAVMMLDRKCAPLIARFVDWLDAMRVNLPPDIYASLLGFEEARIVRLKKIWGEMVNGVSGEGKWGRGIMALS